MEMDTKQYLRYIEKEDSKYFEDDIPMVSSDGEPHAVLTMVAVGLGLIAACFVLFIVVILISCQKRKNNLPTSTKTPQVFSIYGTTTVAGADNLHNLNNNLSDTLEATNKNCDDVELNGKSTSINISETIFSKRLPGISTISC